MHWEVEVEDVPVAAAPPRLLFAPEFEDDPYYRVTPSWPEIPTDNLSEKSIAAIRAHHVPRDESVNLIAVQQAVMDDAARKYAGHITAIETHGLYGGFSLARIPGQQLSVLVAVDGHIKLYIATATDTVGGFDIEDQEHDWG